jgi:hypothetical protein
MEQVFPGGIDISDKGDKVEIGCGRVNIEQILYTHVCKWKNDT